MRKLLMGIDFGNTEDVSSFTIFRVDKNQLICEFDFPRPSPEEMKILQSRIKKMIKQNQPLKRIPFPEETAPIAIEHKCPICGEPLMMNAGEGLERDLISGQWLATEVQLDCTSEPDIKSPDWDDWYRGHYSMPYLDWLPLHQKVLKEVRQKYYFTE